MHFQRDLTKAKQRLTSNWHQSLDLSENGKEGWWSEPCDSRESPTRDFATFCKPVHIVSQFNIEITQSYINDGVKKHVVSP